MLSCEHMQNRKLSGSFSVWVYAVLLYILSCPAISMAIQDGGSASTSVIEKQTLERLVTQNSELLAELRLLHKDIARMKLDLAKSEKSRMDLEQFITDHDVYGTAYEQYTYFREKTLNEERLRKAAQTRAKRDAQKRMMQELREQRNKLKAFENEEKDKQREVDSRHAILRKAGFTQIGDDVFVGQMGYAYRTTKQKKIRYSPVLELYYLDEDEEIDYNKLMLSGSIIHAGELKYDLSIAIAFYDASNNQIGQTTVQIDGAKPGIPYPFSSEVLMANNRAFRSYAAWILYYEPVPKQEFSEPGAIGQPLKDKPSDTGDTKSEDKVLKDKPADNTEVDKTREQDRN